MKKNITATIIAMLFAVAFLNAYRFVDLSEIDQKISFCISMYFIGIQVLIMAIPFGVKDE